MRNEAVRKLKIITKEDISLHPIPFYVNVGHSSNWPSSDHDKKWRNMKKHLYHIKHQSR